MSQPPIPAREIAERPDGYQGPNLSPRGLTLAPHRLADGVYALMATLPPKDNNGLVAGRDAALIVDAGITPEVSTRIRALAGELTDRPPRYLANTTYHGDHTFGNMGFPDDVVIVSSRLNKENMTDLDYEKKVRSGNMHGDEGLLDTVTRWRTPDVVFDSFAEIDLGGRTVQLWHFGPGNGPGDTIVYVPDTRTAWTGNFLGHAGVAHMLLQGGPEPYVGSLRRMREALPELRTIVPGHGPMGDGPAAIDALIAYLERLHDEVAASVEAGRTLAETEAACTDPWADDLDPALAEAIAAAYDVPPELARRGMLELCRHLHRLNVLSTYRLYEAGPAES
ncbi:MBL fold metallo-hydrolase [Actinomadura opuntiae]|uniref:MBL fold metallo-hydrolase n=1 Tax=Actinomadura sp. OS1-43 TaxID=604315 RepID=UPI00255AEF66|nr:MBL fold metallo-hydrolase [Actinomadura sp. OS1-43]MDL4814104.1 MBL fold metallo-hydrolase [Actinomadura sp. OS1-43]